MILDTKRHTVEINGKVLKLDFNLSGHYVIPMLEYNLENCNVVFHFENLKSYSKSEKRNKAVKLHRQFAHASKERLIRLLKNGGCDDTEFLNIITEFCEKCQFCQKYKKPKLKPVVGLPKSDYFNEVVVMDLKEVKKGKIWILHLIDSFSRYTATALIESKQKEIVVERY